VTTSNNLLDCNDIRSTQESTSNWIVQVYNQAELDDFMNNATSFTNETSNRCIQLSLTRGTYTLDVVNMMQLKLGTGGGLIVVSDLDELRNSFRSISNVALVAFDGLIYDSCPVPKVIEEVSVVVVKNCTFR